MCKAELSTKGLIQLIKFLIRGSNGEFSRREIIRQRSNNFVPDLNQKDAMETTDTGMTMTPKQHTGPKAVRKENRKENQRTKENPKEKMMRKEKEKVKPIKLNPLPIQPNLTPPMVRMPLTGENMTLTGTMDGPQIHMPHNHGKEIHGAIMPIMESGMTPQRRCLSRSSLGTWHHQNHTSLNVQQETGMNSTAPQRSTRT